MIHKNLYPLSLGLLSVQTMLTVLAVLAVACVEKVPLRENPAQFALTSSHWFANEQTQYVFFSVAGLRPAQARLDWPTAFEISPLGDTIPGLVTKADGFAPLDLAKAVHRHKLVECGSGRLCGSFSFHTVQAVPRLKLRFRYHSSSPMQEEALIATAVHPAGDVADAQSALVYGVFNEDNSRLQVRVHDNFGTPNSQEIGNYGMERTFAVEGLQSVDLTLADEKAMLASAGTPFLFPASVCVNHLTKAAGGARFKISGGDGWAPTVFDPKEPQSDACFSARTLDKTGAILNSAAAIARKNPVLLEQPLTIRPPLRESWQIPIVLSYCLDRPDSAVLTSADFLRYQYYILGVNPKMPIDACFATHDEERFAIDLERVLNQKLAAARSANAAGGDFFFTVIINHALAPQIKKFHQIIGQTLALKINSEVKNISPRLVGAFVYDSQAAELRGVDAGPNVVWCPHLEPELGGGNSDANCTPRSAGNVSLGPFNFLLPMGPFPTLEAFVDYHQKYGDRGETTNPHFNVRAVQTNPNSVTGDAQGKFFTFFDGERLSLAKGERIKFCRERDQEQLFSRLAFRQSGPDGLGQVLHSEGAQQVVAQAKEAVSLHVGLWWDSPFLGAFSFDTPVRGKVFGLIPLSSTFSNRQKLGDPLWAKAIWDLTPLLQKCERHCDHPYFDEAGVYQVNLNWNEGGVCPTPQVVKAPQ